MSTAVALRAHTIQTFLGNIDRPHVEVSANREVPTRIETSAFPAACETKGQQRPSFLTALLRSLFAFAA